MDTNIIQFGKYKGEQFQAVLEKTGYCDWLIEKYKPENQRGNIDEFVEYIKQNKIKVEKKKKKDSGLVIVSKKGPEKNQFIWYDLKYNIE